MRQNTARPRLRHVLAGVRALVGLAVLVVSLLAFQWLLATRPVPPQRPASEAVRTVGVVTMRPVEIAREWEGYGTARSADAARVVAEVAAVVVERPERIDPGAAVERGELIVRLEESDYRQALEAIVATIASLRAQVESLDVEQGWVESRLDLANEATLIAERELERVREAERRGAARSNEIDRQLQQLTIVRREEQSLRERLETIPSRRQNLLAQIRREDANRRRAELDIERASVVAPVDGVIQTIDVNVGERLQVGQFIARIVDLSLIEIPVRLPASAALRVRVGDRAVVTTEGAEQKSWTGELVRIEPEADPTTRTIGVFVEVEQDPDGGSALLLPGQFVSATVRSFETVQRLVAPRLALRGDRLFVVDESGRAAARRVEVERRIERAFPEIHPRETQWAVIEAGLRAGERVIVSNLDELVPGLPVEPVDAADEAIAGDADPARQGAGR